MNQKHDTMKKFNEKAIQEALQRNGLTLPTTHDELSAFWLKLMTILRRTALTATMKKDLKILYAAVKPLEVKLENEVKELLAAATNIKKDMA